jgi:hypothetical protein
VEDHHVDRPGVEAQQCVQLTGTNSSIDLIALINDDHETIFGKPSLLWHCFLPVWWQSEEKIPDPIPNSTVKILCADGTSSQDVGE